MGIGAYRHLVTLEPPGGQVVDPPTWYCALQSAATQVSDGLAAFYVRGRYHPGLTLETQLNFEGRTFQVQSISDVDERHREVQLLCVEVVGRGRSLDTAPTILVGPASIVTFGQNVVLTVEAAGTPPLSYQWLKNGVLIPGATGASYTTGTLTVTTTYSVRVSNVYGFVTSDPATVTVVTPATITTQPQGATTSGASVTLTVVAAGTPPLAYQWMKAGVDLPGATGASYATGPVSATAVYTVRVANAYGAVTSAPATVTYSNPLMANLVSYWSFDAGWTDVHGTDHLTNHGVTAVAGKLGQAGDFERSLAQYLSHPDPMPLGDEDFTFALWFKRESLGGSQTLIGKDHDTNRRFMLGFDAANLLAFTWHPAGGASASLITDTNWHFVVIWREKIGQIVQIQVDNGTPSQGAGAFGTVGTPSELQIGARQYPGFRDYFDGLIDDVGLWRRLLTPAERTQLWNAGNGLAYPFG